MNLFVDGQRVELKNGFSFEYVSENRLFTDADAYSLAIEVPMRSEVNRSIFGRWNRPDIINEKLVLDAELRTKRFSIFGVVTVVEPGDEEIKIQFLEGRSVRNFNSPLDKVYIDELDLGQFPGTLASAISPAEAWAAGREFVALPWINNNVESDVINNDVEYDDETKAYKWGVDVKNLSWQRSLLSVMRAIASAVGYYLNAPQLESDVTFSKTFVFNAVPGTWIIDNYADVLPHWSVEEFFSKLETFFCGEFEINSRSKEISFKFLGNSINERPAVYIDKVINDFSGSVSAEDPKCEYMPANKIGYADCSLPGWSVMSCPWYKPKMQVMTFATIEEMVAGADGFYAGLASQHRGSLYQKIFFVQETGRYYSLFRSGVTEYQTDSSGRKWYNFHLREINSLGPLNYSEDDKEESEQSVDVLPPGYEHSGKEVGWMVYVDPQDVSNGDVSSESDEELTENWRDTEPLPHTWVQYRLEKGEEDKGEIYSNIYVAWWDGVIRCHTSEKPSAYVERFYFVNKDKWYRMPFNFALDRKTESYKNLNCDVDKNINYEFSFLSDEIPDVRAIFIIYGKKFVCEKITAEFNESGLSKLMKGSFYRILD